MARGHLLLITGLDQHSHFLPGLLDTDLGTTLLPPQPPEGACEHPSQILPSPFPSGHQGELVSTRQAKSLLLPEPFMAPTSLEQIPSRPNGPQSSAASVRHTHCLCRLPLSPLSAPTLAAMWPLCSNTPGRTQPQGLCIACALCTPHTSCLGKPAQTTLSKIASPLSQPPVAFLCSVTMTYGLSLSMLPVPQARGWLWRILHSHKAAVAPPAGRGTHRGVGVAVLAVADVDLVLRGLLVHGVVKVDAIDALQSPVLPEEEGPKAQKGKQHCGTGNLVSLPVLCPAQCPNSPAFLFVNGFVLI